MRKLYKKGRKYQYKKNHIEEKERDSFKGIKLPQKEIVHSVCFQMETIFFSKKKKKMETIHFIVIFFFFFFINLKMHKGTMTYKIFFHQITSNN